MQLADHIDAGVYNRIACDTWGHLFPNKGKLHYGELTIAMDTYGKIMVLRNTLKIESSPWYYDSENDFLWSLQEQIEEGTIYVFSVIAQVVEIIEYEKDPNDPCDEDRISEYINIKSFGHKTTKL